MKTYGKIRRDAQACDYGCCTTKSGKQKNGRLQIDRAHRKTARNESKDLIKKQQQD